MTDAVDRTLKLWRSVPFDWGEQNCMLSIASYIRDVTGNDPGAAFRADCHTEADALAIIEAAGGEVALLDATGLAQTDNPFRGDIMLVRSIPALCTGNGAAMRSVRGVIEIDLRFITFSHAWRVLPCRH